VLSFALLGQKRPFFRAKGARQELSSPAWAFLTTQP